MKIAHVLNMANNGYHMVKALREKGVDADLIIDPEDFAMGLPMWEEADTPINPYIPQFEKLMNQWNPPPWIKIWKHKGMIRKNSYLFRMTNQYDLLHLHPTIPIYLQFKNKPYIIHEAGWIRSFNDNRNLERLGRRSYRKAKYVIWTNPDTYPIIHSLGCKKHKFIPFVIPPDKYRPLNIERSEELLFLHPTRQVWDIKANYRLFKAFSKFIEDGNKATLRCVDWGWEEDVKRAKELINKLKINKYVEWVRPYTKPHLIKAYNECTAVFDQFKLGSGGTVCYEAMSCGCPVVIYLDHWNLKCFGEMPPVLNARTSDQIYHMMILLTDKRLRRKISQMGRTFTLTHNSPNQIADELIKVYKEVLH